MPPWFFLLQFLKKKTPFLFPFFTKHPFMNKVAKKWCAAAKNFKNCCRVTHSVLKNIPFLLHVLVKISPLMLAHPRYCIYSEPPPFPGLTTNLLRRPDKSEGVIVKGVCTRVQGVHRLRLFLKEKWKYFITD